MNPEQAAKMLLLLERIANALETLLDKPALQAQPETTMHIVEQPLSINIPRTQDVLGATTGGRPLR